MPLLGIIVSWFIKNIQNQIRHINTSIRQIWQLEIKWQDLQICTSVFYMYFIHGTQGT
jgi:hypothetical protein